LEARTWIEYIRKPRLKEPVAVVGSPGLRSIGRIAVDYLIQQLQPELFAELYSTHFPIIYQTSPSYVAQPAFPGQAGVIMRGSHVELPSVKFYASQNPELVITRGYHANFDGQYEVAEKVLDLFEEFGVKRMVVLAGYGHEGRDVCCAATDPSIVEQMEKHGIGVGYVGPFYGFSGLVFGLGKLRGIKGLCLFGRTVPNLEEPEYPDPEAAKAVLNSLGVILGIEIKPQ